MAEFTKTSYGEIVWMALVPALLYFLSVLLYVHVLAVKGGFKGMQGQTGAWRVLVDGLHFLLPLALITALLLWNYSPVLVGVAGSAAVLLASLLRSHTRINVSQLVLGLRQGAMLAISISVACAVAGLVVGTIGQTGIGLQFTESVVALSGGQLWLALILVAIAALVLGMGLPATAAYIVLAVMTGPALQELGLALITAHMIIFWLAQSSNVTPPIALAAFAGAGVAGASPMASAVEAVKLASGLFVIPLMMAFSPLLLSAEYGWSGVLLSAGVTGLLMLMLIMTMQQYLFAPVTRVPRLLALVAAGLLVYPSTEPRVVGAMLAVAVMAVNYRGQPEVAARS
jgi:TRAP transporter 4TM/12TM fusion protein